jgi:hypothetical protein
MPDVNPYQSPLSSEELLRQLDVVPAMVVEENPFARGLFRKGNQLVMHKRAALPDRCVKSNDPADGWRLRRNLSWHHPMIFILVLVSLLIYVIVALIVRKKATIYVGLSEPWFRIRRRAIAIGWGTALSGLAMIVLAAFLSDMWGPSGDWLVFVIPVAVLMIIGGAIYGILRSQIVSPARITDDYVWLKGIHPAFLAELPEWPYEP